MTKPLKFEFVTKDIFNFIHDTETRMDRMKELVKEKNMLGLFKIEDVSVDSEWDDFYPYMSKKLQTLRTNIDLGRKDTYKLAFFLDFLTLFLKYNGTEEDQAPSKGVQNPIFNYKKNLIK